MDASGQGEALRDRARGDDGVRIRDRPDEGGWRHRWRVPYACARGARSDGLHAYGADQEADVTAFRFAFRSRPRCDHVDVHVRVSFTFTFRSRSRLQTQATE